MTPEERDSMEFMRQSIASHDRQIGELTDRLATVSEQIAANSEQIAANTEQIAANTEQIAANTEQIAANAVQIAVQTANVNKLVEVTNQDAIAIRQLAAIAERHERRLDQLDASR